MGVSTLGAASAALIQHGKPAGTPAAVIESGFTDRQRTTTGTLATIADLARESDVQPPAVVVIGDVVDLHAALG
jgi:uroporphyrin-III C-methyltransferase/precorrin-2 dehydrogenase/sirohydrochlorin ferrochelatase